MSELGYVCAAVVLAGGITLLLRALPFALLAPIRRSAFIAAIGRWMPAGLLVILAVIMLSAEIAARPGTWWVVLVAATTTVIVHLVSKRRALLSIAAGTATYIVVLNLVTA